MARHRYSYYEVAEFRRINKQKSYYFNPKDSNINIDDIESGRHFLNIGNPFAGIFVFVIIIIGILLK